MKAIKFLVGRLLQSITPAMVRSSSLGVDAKVEGGSRFYYSSMGRHSFCGRGCDIYHADIGSFTSIADGVVIGGGRHPLEWAAMSPVFYAGRDSVKAKYSKYDRAAIGRTLVGSDVWIGRSAIVLEGVAIGHGAVVGAGSVVTKPVPAYAIVGGNPATLIRYRFDERTVAALLESRWWDKPSSVIARAATEVRRPEKFIEILKSQG